jgi:hypothetical protein
MSNEMELNGQQAGQPVQADANPSGNGQAATNQPSVSDYVTKAEFEAAMSNFLKQSNSNAQSLVDKKTNAINAKIESLKSFGITATPEQAAKLIESEVTQSPEDSKPEAKQAEDARQVDTPQDSWIKAAGGNPDDPYWGKVYQTSQVFGGMTITPDDPEIEIMNKQFSDGESFASAFFEACNKKYFRMNNQSNLASTPALFGSNKKSNSTPDNTPPHFHYQKAFSGGE